MPFPRVLSPFALYHSDLKQRNAVLYAMQCKWNKQIRQDIESGSFEVSGDELNTVENNSRT